MAVKDTTMQAYRNYQCLLGDSLFTENEFETAKAYLARQTRQTCALSTLLKNNLVKTQTVLMREKYTIQEVLDKLNSCSGEDCYNGEWHFVQDPDGRIFNEWTVEKYKLI